MGARGILTHWLRQFQPEGYKVDQGRRGQTDRGYKKPVTNTDTEIAIPIGIKRLPDN